MTKKIDDDDEPLSNIDKISDEMSPEEWYSKHYKLINPLYDDERMIEEMKEKINELEKIKTRLEYEEHAHRIAKSVVEKAKKAAKERNIIMFE